MTPNTYNTLSDGLDDVMSLVSMASDPWDALDEASDALARLKDALEAAYDRGEVTP